MHQRKFIKLFWLLSEISFQINFGRNNFEKYLKKVIWNFKNIPIWLYFILRLLLMILLVKTYFIATQQAVACLQVDSILTWPFCHRNSIWQDWPGPHCSILPLFRHSASELASLQTWHLWFSFFCAVCGRLVVIIFFVVVGAFVVARVVVVDFVVVVVVVVVGRDRFLFGFGGGELVAGPDGPLAGPRAGPPKPSRPPKRPPPGNIRPPPRSSCCNCTASAALILVV